MEREKRSRKIEAGVLSAEIRELLANVGRAKGYVKNAIREVKIMKVYIVTRGEKNEGLDVIGVFSNETKATKFALSQKVSLSRSWQNIDMNLWESGCDLLEVSCWEVK